ncbi:hypothetical protein JXA63_05830 [Candidatus Woesebacteria bacterium]|nr:hypothetical protein [Candidatus Woesebacteria bacterium]
MPSPETGEVPKTPEQVKERQEEFIVPEKIQDIGLKTTRSQVTAQVTDDDDNQLISTPTRKVTVTLPADKDVIEEWTKGDKAKSSTWLGYFWVRIIKKALHFGWDLVVGPRQKGN